MHTVGGLQRVFACGPGGLGRPSSPAGACSLSLSPLSLWVPPAPSTPQPRHAAAFPAQGRAPQCFTTKQQKQQHRGSKCGGGAAADWREYPDGRRRAETHVARCHAPMRPGSARPEGRRRRVNVSGARRARHVRPAARCKACGVWRVRQPVAGHPTRRLRCKTSPSGLASGLQPFGRGPGAGRPGQEQARGMPPDPVAAQGQASMAGHRVCRGPGWQQGTARPRLGGAAPARGCAPDLRGLRPDLPAACCERPGSATQTTWAGVQTTWRPRTAGRGVRCPLPAGWPGERWQRAVRTGRQGRRRAAVAVNG